MNCVLKRMMVVMVVCLHVVPVLAQNAEAQSKTEPVPAWVQRGFRCRASRAGTARRLMAR